MTRAIAALGIALAMLLYVGMTGGLAQHRHPPEHADLHHKFYQHWKMPDNRNLSCCNDQDCAPVLAAEKRGGVWWAQRASDLMWLRVPPEKIERERDSPDAAAHMCSMGDRVYCFIASGGF